MSVFETRVRIEGDAFGDQAQVVELDGHEQISRLFQFDLLVTLPIAGTPLDVDDVVSSTATLVFEVRGQHAEGPLSSEHWQEIDRVHGLVCQCEDLMLAERYAAYRIRLVPRFWLASLVETLDIFMDVTIADIFRKKLELFSLVEGTDYEIRIDEANYPTLEFVVQYKETDLAFISRLTEHFGVSYYFEHRDGRDVLVFGDQPGKFRAIAGDGKAPFYSRGEQIGVFELRSETRMVPRLFVQRDYNYRQPASDLTASVEMPAGSGGGIVEYGGHFKTEAEGKWLAELRAEEKQCTRQTYRGRSTVPRLRAGAVVELEGHPRSDFRLLLTEVTHRARLTSLMGGENDEAEYRNEFSAIDAETPFRPARVTPRPRVKGMLTGIVEGEAGGQYAEVDDQGRYRVRFMFDTSDAQGAKASRPVRMMQPHAGAGYGMHFPLRPGVEVLITFLDGDPDRPIIAGTVPNPQTASPVSSTNATKNVIRTGGGNEIAIDDQEGSHRIKMSCPSSSTVFQLGAPNSPEQGAMLETMGASSTVALSGYSTVAAWKGVVSAIGDVRSSGDITTVAKKPGPEAVFMAGVSVISALVSAVQTTIGLVQAGMTAAEKGARQQVVDAQEDATAKAKLCEECRSGAEALLPTAAMKADANLIAAADAACTSCDPGAHGGTGCTLSASARADVVAAQQRQALISGYSDACEATEEAYVDQLRARQLYNQSVEECSTRTTDQDDIAYGDKLDERQTAYENAKQTYDDAVDAREQAVKDLGALAQYEDPPGSGTHPYEDYVKAIQACEEVVCAAAETARAETEKKNDSYNELITSHGPHKDNCTEANTYLGLWATVPPLLSLAMFIYGKLKRSQKEVELGALWVAAKGAMAASFPRPTSSTLSYMKVPLSPTHVLGSQHSLHLTACSDLFISCPTVMITGLGIKTDPTGESQVPDVSTGKIGIVGMEEVRVTAKKEIELAAVDKLQGTAATVDVLADDKLVVLAEPRLGASGTGTAEITAKSTMTLQSKDDNIELKTTDDQHILIDQTGSKVEVKTPGNIEATAAATVQLIAGDSDDAGTVAISHKSGPSITVSKDSIVLKVGSKTALELKEDGAVLKYGSSTVVKVNDGEASVTFGSNSVKVTSSGIEQKGTQIKLG